LILTHFHDYARRPDFPSLREAEIMARLWQVPVFVSGLLALGGAWAFHVYGYDPEVHRIESVLVRARDSLNTPDSVGKGVVDGLENTLRRGVRSPEQLTELHFLLGSVYTRQAEKLGSERAQELWSKALDHLQEAKTLGVEPADQARLDYRLAKALFHTSSDINLIAFSLRQSIETGAEDRAEGYDLLTQAYLRWQPPRIQEALEVNARLIQLPAVDEKLLARARLLRGELLLQIKDREGARKALAHIGPDAPPTIQSQALYLRARSYQEDNAWNEAATLWEQGLASSRFSQANRGRVIYWLAVCYRNLGRPADAERMWREIAGKPTEEGQAASLHLGRSRLLAGDSVGALGLFGRALERVGRPEEYRNSLVELGEARAALETSARTLLERGQFEKATEIVNLYTRLGPLQQVELMRAQVAEGWAAARLAAAGNDAAIAVRETKAARDQFLAAGTAFEAAADATNDNKQKTDWLWHAAGDYRQANDAARTVAVLGRFVKLAIAPEKLGEAWYRLGESHQILGNEAAAVGSFARCIEHPSRFAYLARFELAQAEVKRGNLANAEDILQQNIVLLKGADPEAYEKTLYALGFVLYKRENYSLAAQRLDLALKLYPGNPRSIEARFALADCCRRLADAEAPNAGAFVPGIRPHLHKQRTTLLDKAATNYQKLVDDLETRRGGPAPLTDVERRLWRASFFGLADCRFNVGDWAEAGRLYDRMVGHFQHEYEGLLALRGLYRTYVVVGDSTSLVKANATVQRALVILNELDDTVFKGRPETEGREAWGREFQRDGDDLRKAREAYRD
jgi:tetratricopeptide (TPR) repeat protein